MSTALSCVSLAKRLGGKPVLIDIDLAVQDAEVVALLGPSGSGKTTLLRAIAGLVDPDRGSITIGGRTVWRLGANVAPGARQVGMVFQDYALWPHMSVVENLAFGLRAQRVAAPEIARRVDHALEVTRIEAQRQRKPHELSGGQQQRVAIARCLAARPRLMLLDEPLSNLDPALRDEVRFEMMRLVRQEGITVVYVTHDQTDAMAAADRLAIMDGGRIVQVGAPSAIYRFPANAFVARFLGGFSLLSGIANESGIRLDAGAVIAVRERTTTAARLALVIRPEDALPADAFPDNRLEGPVVASAFHGRCWRLLLQIGPAQVRIDWPDACAVGAIHRFSLDPARCVVVDASGDRDDAAVRRDLDRPVAH